MKFYYFGGRFGDSFLQELEDSHFTGVLFTYSPLQGDFFTLMPRDMLIRKKIKYMLAIRPHTISPQYLCMINQSMNSIMPNRLQINLIAGHIKENEKDFGGFVGDVTDLSPKISRSNYLIEYIKELDRMSSKPYVQIPDFYVSVTNPYSFDAASELNNKMIIPYREYNQGYWMNQDENGNVRPGVSLRLTNQRVMLSIGPILRHTQAEIDAFNGMADENGRTKGNKPYYTNDTIFVTYDQFDALIKDLESKGITEIMLHGYPHQERPIIINYVKQYIESKK